eukprot:scaffold48_cov311-Pinguiococcus_pyrenoidosus.AAC.31
MQKACLPEDGSSSPKSRKTCRSSTESSGVAPSAAALALPEKARTSSSERTSSSLVDKAGGASEYLEDRRLDTAMATWLATMDWPSAR